jgi:hypothetical protein
MPVLAFQYGVKSPCDAATGQASGKRQHQPIVITKAWGTASPQLLPSSCQKNGGDSQSAKHPKPQSALSCLMSLIEIFYGFQRQQGSSGVYTRCYVDNGFFGAARDVSEVA